MPSLLSRLYLIRHGETAWSLSGQHTGLTDIPLTEQGERDARKLAERLGAVKFSCVFTSPLQRARRTAELAGLRDIAEIKPDLAEWATATTKDSALQIFVRGGQIGMSFETDVRVAKRPPRSPNAQIG
jgi:broad specificity phosphatase PhoE